MLEVTMGTAIEWWKSRVAERLSCIVNALFILNENVQNKDDCHAGKSLFVLLPVSQFCSLKAALCAVFCHSECTRAFPCYTVTIFSIISNRGEKNA